LKNSWSQSAELSTFRSHTGLSESRGDLAILVDVCCLFEYRTLPTFPLLVRLGASDQGWKFTEEWIIAGTPVKSLRKFRELTAMFQGAYHPLPSTFPSTFKFSFVSY
jgi:hypothetical protein